MNSNNKKIAWVSRSSSTIYINILSKLVNDFGWEGLIISQDKEPKKNNANPFKISYLKPISFPFMLFYVPRKIKSYLTGSDGNVQELVALHGLVEELKKYSPDVVIIDLFYLPMTWQAAWYCWFTDTPYIVTIEKLSIKSGFMYFVDRLVIWISKPILARASLLTAWTNDSLKFTRKYLSPRGSTKVEFLPAGIDMNKFSAVEKYVKTSNTLRIVMVARFVPLKRHVDVINTLEILHKEGKEDICLTLLGEGRLKNVIKILVKEKGLEEFVTFHDPVPYEEMGEFYRNFDLLILASDKEAIGMVVPEAMACGVPAVVSSAAGATMYIKNGVDGYIFKNKNHKSLAVQVMKFKNNQEKVEMGRMAQETICENFSTFSIADKLDTFLQDVA